jgi:Fe-S-cluster containining protein
MQEQVQNIIEINCQNCRECCQFHEFVGEELSLEEIVQDLPFTRDMCDIFFQENDGKYLIEKWCRKYHQGKCELHNSPKKPFMCALFPLLIYKQDGSIKLGVDKNCPKWSEARKIVKQKDFIVKLEKIFENYQNKLFVPLWQDLKRCGYNIFELKDNLQEYGGVLADDR